MLKFEEYLRENGLGYKTAVQFVKTASKYLSWLKENGLTPAKVKRSRFLDFIESLNLKHHCTKTAKQRAIFKYHEFLGTKNNPAKNWLKRKKRHELPPSPIDREELDAVYSAQKPKSPAEYRDRCMVGLVLFQGLLRSELADLRVTDVDFENGTVFIQGQNRTNSRTLKLEPKQALHFYDYLNKYRKELVAYKTHPTDRMFLSKGTSDRMENSMELAMRRIRAEFPHIKSFKAIRGSVISHWDKEEGTLSAMKKAGHRYITSTARYHIKKYEEIREDLIAFHPLDKMDLN